MDLYIVLKTAAVKKKQKQKQKQQSALISTQSSVKKQQWYNSS